MYSLRSASSSSARRSISFSAPCMTASTQSKPRRADVPPMPEERLRALVSLYHQSTTWVTPENLDEYIDRVFASPHTSFSSLAGRNTNFNERNKDILEKVLKARKDAPIHGGRNSQYKTHITPFQPLNTAADKGEIMSKQLREMGAALWGCDVSGNPGVETVRDAIRETTIPNSNDTESS